MARGKPAPSVNDDRFMRAVPGYSFTQPKGKWAWDNPPQEVDPDIVVSDMLDSIESGDKKEQLVKLMFAGVSIQEIVNTIAHTGFAEGKFNPDVAEMIKGPIAIYLLGVADDYNVPVKFYKNSERKQQQSTGLDDSTILEIMRNRNPEFHQFMTESYYDREEDARVQRELKGTKGFLGVEGAPEVSEEGMAEEVPVENMEEER